ncbi:MAG: SUMF1/EgtB/PvdO family nonheme iron enzyme [Chloroflexota bacterium]
MDQHLHDQIVDFIKPFAQGTHVARENTIRTALPIDSPALDYIDWSVGGALPFTQHLIQTIRVHSADDLIYLVDGLKGQVGVDQQAQAETLCQALRQIADPATLAQDIQRYITDLRPAVKADLLEKLFVTEAGDQQTLTAPANEAFTDLLDYDLGDWLESLHTPSPVEVTDRDQQQSGPIDNVRAYLLEKVARGVLLGEPGSGKTWTLLQVLLDSCRDWDSDDEGCRIAVLVKLNQFKGLDPKTKAPLTFSDFVQRAAGPLAPHLNRLAQQDRLLLLCDALNEMPRRGPEGRDLLAEVIDYLEQQPAFIVSCRFHDYKNELQPLYPLPQVRLHDLDLPAIKAFVDNYLPSGKAASLWTKMGGSDDLLEFWREVNKKGEGPRFWDAQATFYGYRNRQAWSNVHQGARLIPLCRKPYMGYLLTTIYQVDGQIPLNRSELFGSFVTNLVAREQKQAVKRGQSFPDEETIRTTLTELAQAMQQAKSTTLSTDALPVNLNKAILTAAEAASLLTFDGTAWAFTHQLLQEYFAARILLAAMEQGHNPVTYLDGDWWKPGVWRETAIILGEVADPNEVAIWLASHKPELALIVLLENGEIQADQLKISALARIALIEGAKARTTEVNPIGRTAAYAVLGHPIIDADRRPGIHVTERSDGVRLPDIDWVTIPDDGPWICQNKQHPGLPAFQISRYPITYAQFQTFIDDSQGFSNPRWWEGLAIDERERGLDVQHFKYWNHPRENVNWYDAMAFCRWLSWRLGGGYESCNIGSWAVRLPTEMEWEKAARGVDGRSYPYGNKFAVAKGNTEETAIGRTSAVGLFLEGASPYGVEEMCGNVYEWCLTKHKNPASIAEEEDISSGDWRVLRGGSWNDGLIGALATFPYGDHPGNRGRDGGFRVIMPPSQDH